jgi:hypothetical protein
MGYETVLPQICEKHKSRGVEKEGRKREVGKGYRATKLIVKSCRYARVRTGWPTVDSRVDS